MFCYSSIVQSYHFGLLSCLASDGQWCTTFFDLTDSWGFLMLQKPFMPCFLRLLCRWMSCSENTQCPFLAFQYSHFEARAVNISPGRRVLLTPRRTCSFTQLNHLHIHCHASVNICCKAHKRLYSMILLSSRGSFTVYHLFEHAFGKM